MSFDLSTSRMQGFGAKLHFTRFTSYVLPPAAVAACLGYRGQVQGTVRVNAKLRVARAFGNYLSYCCKLQFNAIRYGDLGPGKGSKA